MRSINPSGARVISSTFAPRLLWGLLTGSLCCLALRYTSTLPALRSLSSANAGVYRKTAVAVSQYLFSIETFEQSKIAHLQTDDWSLVASDLTQ